MFDLAAAAADALAKSVLEGSDQEVEVAQSGRSQLEIEPWSRCSAQVVIQPVSPQGSWAISSWLGLFQLVGERP